MGSTSKSWNSVGHQITAIYRRLFFSLIFLHVASLNNWTGSIFEFSIRCSDEKAARPTEDLALVIEFIFINKILG